MLLSPFVLQAEPVAQVPVHPRHGRLWANVRGIDASTPLPSYPLDDLYDAASLDKAVRAALAVRDEIASGDKKKALDAVARLSPRHKEIFVLLAKGYISKEIGLLLGITENTVVGYRKDIFYRLGVNGRVAASVLAAKAGLV